MDTVTPIVIMVGPPCSGKTMVAHRLFQYLYSCPGGYCIDVDQAFFGPSEHGQYMYNRSREMLGDIEKVSQRNTEPTLYHIRDNRGNSVIQLLDMMGELFFEPHNNETDYPFPPLINKIISCPNRKIWLQVIEPNYMDFATRERYALRVTYFHHRITSKDKHIIILNKIDKYQTSHRSSKEVPDVIKLVDSNYPHLLSPFRNTHPISSWFHKYDCAVVPFCTGYYYEKCDKEGNPQVYVTPSHDIFPSMLWKVIKKDL